MADPSHGGDGQADALPAINLQILSPSVGVGTLALSNISPTTTVQQLKARIRESLSIRPADDQQRLIHRGRLLARDADSLRDVFGEDTIRSGEQQTLHLVLREPVDGQHGSTPASFTPTSSQSRGQSPAPTTSAFSPLRTETHAHHRPQQPQTTVHRTHTVTFRRVGTPGVPAQPGVASGVAAPAVDPALDMHNQAAQQAHQRGQHHGQQQHQTMMQWVSQLHREAGYRAMLTQQQRERAAMGYHGIQDTPLGAQPAQSQTAEQAGAAAGSSPAMPATGHVTREVSSGPNNHSIRVTVNDTTAAGAPQARGIPPYNPAAGHRPLSAADLHNILHRADIAQATQTMTNAMHRSTSGASLASMANNLAHNNGPFQPIQPGVTTPIFPGVSRHASRTATPDPHARLGGHASGSVPGAASAQFSPGQPEVYVLWSPTGPRGLLINNNSDMYVTPAIRYPFPAQSPYLGVRPAAAPAPHLPFTMPNPIHSPPLQQAGAPAAAAFAPPQPLQQAPPHILLARNNVHAGAPAVGLRQRGAVAPQPAAAALPAQHPANPGAGALVAAAWPHISLILRLVAFVWWFTHNDPSWTRWLTVVGLAVLVFVVNTGLFNGFAGQLLGPVREHLEGLIPFADPERVRRERERARNGDVPAQQPANHGVMGANGEPDPARAAARLVAERRVANAGWLGEQVRRAERAGLLFLASIAPGVAERHIQQLEQQERAERRAREEEARRAAEEAAAAAQDNAAGEANEGGADAAPGEGQAPGEANAGQQPAVPDNRHLLVPQPA